MTASKQMAFQILEGEIHQILQKLGSTFDKKSGLSVTQWLESIDPDPLMQQKYKAVFSMSLQCQRQNKSPWLIRKLICWRNGEGQPDQLEAEWKDNKPFRNA